METEDADWDDPSKLINNNLQSIITNKINILGFLSILLAQNLLCNTLFSSIECFYLTNGSIYILVWLDIRYGERCNVCVRNAYIRKFRLVKRKNPKHYNKIDVTLICQLKSLSGKPPPPHTWRLRLRISEKIIMT